MKGDNMTEQQTDAVVPVWDPLATVEPTTVPLEASGGRASVTYRPWSGRERLAFEDATTERFLTTGTDGDETIRMGSYTLFAVSLTVVGSDGFPSAADGRVFLTGTREQREADLLSIAHAPTFQEIRRTALKVQPLPRAEEAAAGVADDEDDGDEGSPEGNPSPTSSTSPATT